MRKNANTTNPPTTASIARQVAVRHLVVPGAVGFLAGGIAETAGFKEGGVGGMLAMLLINGLAQSFEKCKFGRFSLPLAVLLTILLDIVGLHNVGRGGGPIPYLRSEGLFFDHAVFYSALLILIVTMQSLEKKSNSSSFFNRSRGAGDRKEPKNTFIPGL